MLELGVWRADLELIPSIDPTRRSRLPPVGYANARNLVDNIREEKTRITY